MKMRMPRRESGRPVKAPISPPTTPALSTLHRADNGDCKVTKIVLKMYSFTSFLFACSLLVGRGSFFFNLLGHASHMNTVESTCYGASMLGEAVLQYMAGTEEEPDGPFKKVFPYFFIPYKIASGFSLVLNFSSHPNAGHAAIVGFQWIGACLLYVIAVKVDDCRQHKNLREA